MAIQFLEKTLEDIIFENDNEKLYDRGLDIEGIKKRQVRIGNYGIADIITFQKITEQYDDNKTYNTLLITIYELKQQKIDANTMMQAFRYRKGVERYLKFRNKKMSLRFKIVLIGSQVCKGDFCYMQQYIPHVSIYTYTYELNGIAFEPVGSYSLTEEGFKHGS